jgi:hypothetical protein
MTNPTSNFGWQMPTPTDLVTDLPADFEVFGQAVDTSMADLKGGTTGQILSKATNTDMDFTWITNDVGDITAVNVTAPITGGGSSGAVTIGVSAASTSTSGVVQLSDSTSTTSSVLASTPTATKSAYDLANTANTAAGTAQTTANAAIPKSTVTTAGDVIYATGSAAVTRLGIGTANQVLRVNSGATAPEWATVSSGSLTKIGTTRTFNNVATYDVDSVFSSTYNAYLVVISEIYAASQADDLHLQTRYSTTTSTTGHTGAIDVISYAGTSTITGSNNAAQMLLSNACGASSFPTTATFNVVMPKGGGSSGRVQVYGEGFNALGDEWNQFGYENSNSQIYTGFRLKSSSSNISGTLVVYGLEK